MVEEHRPDGRVIPRPDLSVAAMASSDGEREPIPQEFEQHFERCAFTGREVMPLWPSYRPQRATAVGAIV